MNRSHRISLLGGLGMLALILDGQTALRGAAAGMELCLKTVLPSLFPFLFFCGLLTSALWGGNCCWLGPLAHRLGIPGGGEALLIAAVLGGYPAGAAAIGEAYREKKLSKEDAAHLLGFCSNAGPAFLFGITAIQFSDGQSVWAIWTIQILSALLTGLLRRPAAVASAAVPDKSADPSQVLMNAIKAMGAVCGWILLFQVLLAFLDRWFFWPLPETIRIAAAGLLELSSGCCALGRVENEALRFLCCNVMLAFGGICVAMQTASVITPLPLIPYIRGKLTQTAIALCLALLWQTIGWGILWAGLLLIPFRAEKRGGFLRRAGV